MITAIRQTAELETLEWVYAKLTDGRPLIKDQEGARFRFDDDAWATGLDDAVATGKALVGFADNQLRQWQVRGPVMSGE